MDVETGQPSNAPAGSASPSPSPSPPTSPTKENAPLKGEVSAGESQPEGASTKTPTGGRNKNPSIKIRKQYSKIYRIKTKILQNLGKADKTADEVFDDYEVNFNRQQSNANRLQREVSNYLRCARALHGASKTLFETLSEVYEPQWVGHDLIYVQASNSDMLWTDFCHKLQDQTLNPLSTYTQEFPEIRKKIDKRGRKLVDYDSQRHQLESLQRATRRDEYKIARAKDQLETARVTYEAMNKELYNELPVLFDQRIPRISDCLQTMYAGEATFMAESSKISSELESIAEKLHNECSKGTYNALRESPPKPKVNLNLSNQSNQSVEITPTKHSPTVRPTVSNPISNAEPARPYEDIEFEEKKVNGTSSPKTNGQLSGQIIPEAAKPKIEEIYEIPVGATTTGLPSGVLYRVRATYKYVREDVDELGFDVGEVINVVEYDDPEEQEEGWLCGKKENSEEKGLFPANFTRPI